MFECYQTFQIRIENTHGKSISIFLVNTWTFTCHVLCIYYIGTYSCYVVIIYRTIMSSGSCRNWSIESSIQLLLYPFRNSMTLNVLRLFMYYPQIIKCWVFNIILYTLENNVLYNPHNNKLCRYIITRLFYLWFVRKVYKDIVLKK